MGKKSHPTSHQSEIYITKTITKVRLRSLNKPIRSAQIEDWAIWLAGSTNIPHLWDFVDNMGVSAIYHTVDPTDFWLAKNMHWGWLCIWWSLLMVSWKPRLSVPRRVWFQTIVDRIKSTSGSVIGPKDAIETSAYIALKHCTQDGHYCRLSYCAKWKPTAVRRRWQLRKHVSTGSNRVVLSLFALGWLHTVCSHQQHTTTSHRATVRLYVFLVLLLFVHVDTHSARRTETLRSSSM